MNKQLLGVIGIVVIALVGGVVLINQQQSSSSNLTQTVMEKKNDGMMEKKETVMEKKDEMIEKPDGAMMVKAGNYTTYSSSMYDETKGMKRVLFFHATWCPTCKSADKEFTDGLSQIPAGVVVLKTDYDKEKALKTKYGITYQHTFVQVDDEGNELAKWNGGGIKELVNNIK